ncbi:MAG: BRO family protein [Oscillospiraceae bacterium]
MDLNLQIFTHEEFSAVRTVTENDKPLFCGSDVTKVLGYSNSHDALARHCKGVVKRNIVTNGGRQELSFIPEGDLFRLIVHSKLPAAQKYERWIFEEVIPTIRKHGAYMTEAAVADILSNPDRIIELATAMKRERENPLQSRSAFDIAMPDGV